jgi:perosamine synthetase
MIKFSKLEINNQDIKTVGRILKSGWITHGQYTSEFEREFANFTKSKYAVTVSSCTAALHLSCIASDFKKGDEILLPAQTHTATAHAIEYCGAKPIFIDVEELTGNIDINILKKKITKKTKGLIIVHMAGYPCNMTEILKICRSYKIKLIEDCAHAVGTTFKNKHVGNFGITGCFSFYPTKQITTGEGGMVITNNKKIYKKIKALKAFGYSKDLKERKIPGDYDVKYLGYNFRMTDFQAALGLSQLKRYKKNLKLRKKVAKYYCQLLAKSKLVKFEKFSSSCSYFIFQIFVKKRNFILEQLRNNKIGLSIHYKKPVSSMSYYKKKYRLNNDNYFNAIEYGNQNISLPNYPKLKKSEIKKICNVILSSL